MFAPSAELYVILGSFQVNLELIIFAYTSVMAVRLTPEVLMRQLVQE